MYLCGRPAAHHTELIQECHVTMQHDFTSCLVPCCRASGLYGQCFSVSERERWGKKREKGGERRERKVRKEERER